MSDRPRPRPMDAPRTADEAPDLPVRQTGTPEAHLRALHEELRTWAPKIAAALDRDSVTVTYRNRGPSLIVWDTDADGFVWAHRRSEVIGTPDDLSAAVRVIAKVLGAPVRTM